MTDVIMPLFGAGLFQNLGDLVVIGIVLGLGAFGYQQGLFLAILTLLHAMAAVVAGLAFAEPVAAWLIAVDMPKEYAFVAAVVLVATTVAVGIRLAIGAYVPDKAVEFESLIDKIGGGVIGALAGVVVAGGVLVLLSIAPVPEAYTIDPGKLRFDMGQRVLRSFVRCVETDAAKRTLLLEGERWAAIEKDEQGRPRYPKKPLPPEPPADGSPPPPFELPPTGLWSEAFADLNGNKSYDPGEPFLDDDRDGVFSKAVRPEDGNGNSDRDVGLLDRYGAHQWEKWRVIEASWDDLWPIPELPADP